MYKNLLNLYLRIKLVKIPKRRRQNTRDSSSMLNALNNDYDYRRLIQEFYNLVFSGNKNFNISTEFGDALKSCMGGNKERFVNQVAGRMSSQLQNSSIEVKESSQQENSNCLLSTKRNLIAAMADVDGHVSMGADSNVQLMIHELQPATAIPLHNHPGINTTEDVAYPTGKQEIFYVVKGKIKVVKTNEKTKVIEVSELGPGDFCVVEKKQNHTVVVVGEDSALLLEAKPGKYLGDDKKIVLGGDVDTRKGGSHNPQETARWVDLLRQCKEGDNLHDKWTVSHKKQKRLPLSPSPDQRNCDDTEVCSVPKGWGKGLNAISEIPEASPHVRTIKRLLGVASASAGLFSKKRPPEHDGSGWAVLEFGESGISDNTKITL